MTSPRHEGLAAHYSGTATSLPKWGTCYDTALLQVCHQMRQSPEVTRIRKYIGLITCAVVIMGAVVTVAVARPWPHEVINSVPPVRYVGVHEQDAPFSYYQISQFAQAIGMQPNLV